MAVSLNELINRPVHIPSSESGFSHAARERQPVVELEDMPIPDYSRHAISRPKIVFLSESAFHRGNEYLGSSD